MARRALEALVRVLVQAGQWRLGFSLSVVLVAGFVPGVENLTVMRVLRDRGWAEVEEEPGQRGWSLAGVEEGFCEVEVEVDGVRAGTQKDGSVALEDYRLRVLIFANHGKWRIGGKGVPFPHQWPFELSLFRPCYSVASALHPTRISVSCLDPHCVDHHPPSMEWRCSSSAMPAPIPPSPSW